MEVTFQHHYITKHLNVETHDQHSIELNLFLLIYGLSTKKVTKVS